MNTAKIQPAAGQPDPAQSSESNQSQRPTLSAKEAYHEEQEQFFDEMNESEMSRGEYIELLNLQNEWV